MDRPDAVPMYARIWELMEQERARIEAVLWERIRAIPAMATAFAGLDLNDPAVAAEQERSRELSRRALVEGDWEPYLANLRLEGRRYAQLGVPLGDWFTLLDPWRSVLIPAALLTEDPLPLVLAIDRFVDLAMSEIGGAYVLEKQALVRTAEDQRDLYAKLFRSCPLALAVNRFDEDGSRVVVDMNGATEAIRDRLQPDPEELRAQQDRYTALARRVLETGEPTETTYSFSGLTLRQWLVRLDDRHVGSISEDVTEKERVHRALRRTNLELQRSNQDLDEFAYVASHDLRAPLRDIENLARWLQEDLGAAIPEESARHVTRLRERVSRMERLLEDLLQYSRAGRTSGVRQAIDLDQAVASAVALAGVPPTFALEVDGGALLLHSPRPPLELVLRNLVANAVKHHHLGAGRIVVSWTRREGVVEIAVADDGPGIAPEYHERVFQMFQTLKPRDTVEGSGMGLAVVRRVVEAHGGQVSVASAGDGTGATFRFSWPLEWTGADDPHTEARSE